ncbi:Phosphoesterase family domain containing protein [Rhypophila sp. PSN 637]
MTLLSLALLALSGAVSSLHTTNEHELAPRAIVAGKTFDRFVQIFLENQDYSKAIKDIRILNKKSCLPTANLAYLASQGISLSNYFAIRHPSQGNYVAAVGGNTFGVTGDGTYNIAATVPTVVDLLEAKGISWSIYQEDMPYSGFTGNSPNAQGQPRYVRKHNPLISYQSISNSPSRLAKTKNFTLFNQELAANTLPQWMFITPNMTNDGHDTSLSFAGNWARNWLTPLLANPKFNINRTLVILTFDEDSGTTTNRVYAVLLGSAIPTAKKGTTNSTTYGHYSLIKTVEVNWSLGNLGQGDVGANAFF